MDNIKKYNNFIYEMKVQKEEPQENFTPREISALENNEGFKFKIVLKNKAICTSVKYIISIYKYKSNDFLYRIRKDVSGPFNPIIIEKKVTCLRDCLYEIDEFMYRRTKEDREKAEIELKIKKGLIEPPPKEKKNVFSYKSFSGNVHM